MDFKGQTIHFLTIFCQLFTLSTEFSQQGFHTIVLALLESSHAVTALLTALFDLVALVFVLADCIARCLKRTTFTTAANLRFRTFLLVVFDQITFNHRVAQGTWYVFQLVAASTGVLVFLRKRHQLPANHAFNAPELAVLVMRPNFINKNFFFATEILVDTLKKQSFQMIFHLFRRRTKSFVAVFGAGVKSRILLVKVETPLAKVLFALLALGWFGQYVSALHAYQIILLIFLNAIKVDLPVNQFTL